MKHIYFLVFILTFSTAYSQCTIVTSTSTFGHGTITPTPFGQGFTVTCDGYLEYVQLTGSHNGTVSAGTLNIYSGNSISGTPIYTQSHPAITVTNANNKQIRVDLTGDLEVTNGSQYTFEFTVDNNVGVRANFTNVYPGGSSFRNNFEEPSRDLRFEVSISDTSLSIGNGNTEKINLKVFPNPSSKSIQISGLKEKTNYSIYNILGSEIKNGAISNHTKIDISNFNNGLYFLKLNNGNTIKFIKE